MSIPTISRLTKTLEISPQCKYYFKIYVKLGLIYMYVYNMFTDNMETTNCQHCLNQTKIFEAKFKEINGKITK